MATKATVVVVADVVSARRSARMTGGATWVGQADTGPSCGQAVVLGVARRSRDEDAASTREPIVLARLAAPMGDGNATAKG